VLSVTSSPITNPVGLLSTPLSERQRSLVRSGYNQLCFQLLNASAFGMQGRRECVEVRQLFIGVLGATCSNEGSEKGTTGQPRNHQMQFIFLVYAEGVPRGGYTGTQGDTKNTSATSLQLSWCLSPLAPRISIRISPQKVFYPTSHHGKPPSQQPRDKLLLELREAWLLGSQA